MLKARILLFLGIWVTILPYLGFPYSWKDFLGTISGLALIIISYLFYRDHKSKENQKKLRKTFDNFRENNDFEKKDNNVIDGINNNEFESAPEKSSEDNNIGNQ